MAIAPGVTQHPVLSGATARNPVSHGLRACIQQRRRGHESLMLGRMVNPVAALVAEIAVIDAELGDELRRTIRRIVVLVRLLEPVLRRFAELELRLERTIAQVEEVTGQEVSDELRDRVAGRLGILRVRPALERLGRAHPDVLDASNADVPA